MYYTPISDAFLIQTLESNNFDKERPRLSRNESTLVQYGDTNTDLQNLEGQHQAFHDRDQSEEQEHSGEISIDTPTYPSTPAGTSRTFKILSTNGVGNIDLNEVAEERLHGDVKY